MVNGEGICKFAFTCLYAVDKRFNFHLKLISYLVWEMENGLLLLDRQ